MNLGHLHGKSNLKTTVFSQHGNNITMSVSPWSDMFGSSMQGYDVLTDLLCFCWCLFTISCNTGACQWNPDNMYILLTSLVYLFWCQFSLQRLIPVLMLVVFVPVYKSSKYWSSADTATLIQI